MWLYELSYDQVQVAEQGGTQVLTLTKGSTVTKSRSMTCPASWRPRGCPPLSSPSPGASCLLSDVSPPGLVRPLGGHRLQCGAHLRRGEEPLCANQTLTVAEALKLAATIESRYQGDDFHLSTEGGPYWYVPAVDYCLPAA